jgi:hypothetical protein
VSAFYGRYGKLRLRKCPEAEELVKKLVDCDMIDVEVSNVEADARPVA